MSYLFTIIILIIIICSFCNSICFAQGYSYMASQDEILQYLFFDGVNYINKQQFDEAIKVLEEAYKINPKQMQVMGELCYSYSQKEYYDKMLELAKKGLLIAQQQLSKDNIGRFYCYIGDAYKLQNKYFEAIKYLQLAIYNKPHFIDNYLSLSYCYYKIGRYSAALDLYDLIKKQDYEYYKKNDLEESRKFIFKEGLEKDYAIKHLDLGLKYRAEKNYSAAINEYKIILDKEPEDITSLSQMIINQILNDSGNYDEIIDFSKKLLTIIDRKENKNNYDAMKCAYTGLCFSYSKQNNTKLYSEYKKLNDSLTILREAEEELSLENIDESIKKYEEAIGITSNIEEAKYNYAPLDGLIELAFNIKDYEIAKKYISVGIKYANKEKNTNKTAKYFKDIASYFGLQNKHEEAKMYYEKGLEMTTDLDDKFKFNLGLALCHSALGNINEELNYYEKCKDYLSEDAVEMITDLDSSIVRCKSLLDENSDLNLGMKHLAKGENYYEAKKYKEAVDEFVKSLKHIPQKLETLHQLGLALRELNTKDELLEDVYLEGFKVSKRDKDNFYLDAFSIILGNHYYEKENYRMALLYYNSVTGENPYFPPQTLFSLIGSCHLLLKEIEQSIKAYEMAYRLDPTDEETSEQLKLCRELLNNKKEQ